MVRVAGVMCAMLVLMAGCGGGDGSGEAATTVGPEPTSALGRTVVPVEVAPCDLVTGDEVAAATGLAVADVVDEPPITCVFDLGIDADVDVFVTVDDGEGRLAGPAAVFEGYRDLVAEGRAEPIDGVGAAAFYSPNFRAVVVDAGGGRFIGVGVNGGFAELAEPKDALISLAEAALGRL